MLKKLGVVFAVAVCLGAAESAILGELAQDRRPTTVGALIDRHVEAVGGREAILATRSLDYRGFVREEDYEARIHTRVRRPGRVRFDLQNVKTGGRLTEAFDGETAWWRRNDDSAEALSPEGRSGLWRGTEFAMLFRGLFELPLRGHDLRLAPKETVDGVAYWVIEVRLSDGFASKYYLHPESWMIERARDARPIHPDLDLTEQSIETRWSDFRPVAGVLRPHRSLEVEVGTGETLRELEFVSIVANEEEYGLDLFQAAELLPAERNGDSDQESDP